jgi:DNA polymerase-4
MQSLGIQTGKDLKKLSLAQLQKNFGKSGLYYYNISRGIDNRPVNGQRISKSIGVEITFQQDIKTRQEAVQHLQNLLENALKNTTEKQLVAHTLTVKIKYHDFVQITRSRTLPDSVTSTSTTLAVLEHLLSNTDIGNRNVRLLGVTLSSLENKPVLNRFQQMDLFSYF